MVGRRCILFALLCLCVDVSGIEAREWEESDFEQGANPRYSFTVPPQGSDDKTRTVVGKVQTYRPSEGDTFYDVGRYFGLGHNEMVAANPGIDEWIPAQSGRDITLPTEFILPCCKFEGLVINIPEMRLYYYPPQENDGARTLITYPVGLGRVEWRTPQGAFRVTEKTTNPTWVIPESIRKERIEEKGSSEYRIDGGSPENPLGKFRMRLSLPLYAIHGTNIPWGVGMSVSHGCIRMYPEDIKRLYPRVPVGTPGEFVYETVKVGERDGRVYVEVHQDLYGLQPGRWRHALARLEERGLLHRVDEARLHDAIEQQSGMPVDVTRDGGRSSHGSPGEFRPRVKNSLDADDPYPN